MHATMVRMIGTVWFPWMYLLKKRRFVLEEGKLYGRREITVWKMEWCGLRVVIIMWEKN